MERVVHFEVIAPYSRRGYLVKGAVIKPIITIIRENLLAFAYVTGGFVMTISRSFSIRKIHRYPTCIKLLHHLVFVTSDMIEYQSIAKCQRSVGIVVTLTKIIVDGTFQMREFSRNTWRSEVMVGVKLQVSGMYRHGFVSSTCHFLKDFFGMKITSCIHTSTKLCVIMNNQITYFLLVNIAHMR